MKNWLAMSLVAVCIGLLSCDTSMALGGNNNGGSGGAAGKNSTQGRFLVSNTSATEAVRVLILPAGTPIPATLGAVDAQSFVVGPGSTDVGALRNAGLFDIHVIDASLFAAGLAGAGAAAASTAADDTATINLAGSDITVQVTVVNGFADFVGFSR